MSCARGCCSDQLTHYRSVRLSASATPTRASHASRTMLKESQWDRDMPAYKRLRRDGVQPKQIDGAAELEAKAQSPIEIESGNLLTKKQLDQVGE